MLIVEFVNGPNLLHFLRKHRPTQPKPAPSRPLEQRQPITEGHDGEGPGNNLFHFLRKHLPAQPSPAPSQPLEQGRPVPERGEEGEGAGQNRCLLSWQGRPVLERGEEGEGAGQNRCLLSWQELASLALQVAKGMEHLAAFKVRIDFVCVRACVRFSFFVFSHPEKYCLKKRRERDRQTEIERQRQVETKEEQEGQEEQEEGFSAVSYTHLRAHETG